MSGASSPNAVADDKIVLYNWPSEPHRRRAPFVLKAECWLRFTNTPYKIVVKPSWTKFRQNSYIECGDLKFTDTDDAFERLNGVMNWDLVGMFLEEQHAIARAFGALINKLVACVKVSGILADACVPDMQKDLDAIDVYLRGKTYFFGLQPHIVDAQLFSVAAPLLWIFDKSPLRLYLNRKLSLLAQICANRFFVENLPNVICLFFFRMYSIHCWPRRAN